MAMCPYASQFMVFGEARNYCVALIALDADLMSVWAAENGLNGATYEELVNTPVVRDMIAEHMAHSTPSSTDGKPSRSGRCWTTICPSRAAS